MKTPEERTAKAKMRERWVSHWSGYTIALVRYDFYMFLRRRLKICHVFGAFNINEDFGAFEGEGRVTIVPTTNSNSNMRDG